MTRIFWALLLAVLTLYMTPLDACVGKTLHIGILASPDERMLAELTSQLLTARTGTTVKVDIFQTQAELYSAVKQGQLGMIIESTDRALTMTGKPNEAGNTAFDAVKAQYRKSLNLIWLKPYGPVQGGSSSELLAPVISNDTLSSLPALPKLLTKLAGITGDPGYSKVMKAKGDENPQELAKKLLKAKKLI